MIRGRFFAFLLFPFLAASMLYAEAPPQKRRYTIGARLQVFPSELFDTEYTTASTTSPVADYEYTGSSESRKLSVSPTLEFRLTRRLSLGGEFMMHHAQYKEVEEMRSGTRDANATTDDREVTTTTRTTKANYWELPVLARYYGLRSSGQLSRVYVVGGLGLRYIGRIRTGNEFSYADDTTDYNESPAVSDRKLQVGAVMGVGYRFIDDFNIKLMPEVRITRWAGYTFHGASFRSVKNELRVGLGISF